MHGILPCKIFIYSFSWPNFSEILMVGLFIRRKIIFSTIFSCLKICIIRVAVNYLHEKNIRNFIRGFTCGYFAYSV